MTTPGAASRVSAVRLGRATVVAALFGAAACAGRPHPVTRAANMERAEGTASTLEFGARPATIEFDNEATVHVDVYVVTERYQWRLGRVLPGARVELKVPESAIESTMGMVRLAVIPGSQMSAQAAQDPRAVLAIAQPMSELLSSRWTYRQSATAAMRLQRTAIGRPDF